MDRWGGTSAIRGSGTVGLREIGSKPDHYWLYNDTTLSVGLGQEDVGIRDRFISQQEFSGWKRSLKLF